MAQTVGQHTVATFTTPLNGTSPIDATTVRTNDNTLRIGYNDHDVDAGIHLQSSLLASRPGASESGRKWMTTDTGAVKVFFDTGSTWVEISYLPITGGTVTGAVTVTGLLTASGGVAGNASTATALQTARTINGVSFDGTANITVTAAANTLTGSTLASGVTGSSLTSVGTLTTGAIGAGFTAIPNTALANSSVTVNGTAIALGASGTVTAAAGTLTGSTLASGVTASSLTSLGTLSALAVTGTTTLNTVAYTWPSTDGSSGQVLSTNGSGTLSWIFTGGGGSIATLTAGSFLTGGSFNGTLAATFAVDATDASTASKVVSRDGSGASSFDAVKFDGATSGTVTVKAAAVAGTWDLTLPTTDGDAGQVLTTNGSGVTSWATVAPVDSTINPSASSPYSVVSSDMNKRLVIGSTATLPIVNLTASNLSGVGVGSQFQIAAFGSATSINASYTEATDPVFNPILSILARVYAVAAKQDGKIFIGGDFTTVSGTARNFIARLNANGSLDEAFNATATGTDVRSILPLADGRVYVGGNYTDIGGAVQANFARLFETGKRDAGFPNAALLPNGLVSSMQLQSDGKLILGGSFSLIGSGTPTARNRIARYNANDTLDTGYNPNANGNVLTIAIQSDGKAVVGGAFTTMGGTARNRIARLNTDGTLDTGFNPDASSQVEDIVIQPDGKIVIVGQFTTVGGTARNRIARLNTDGTLDTGFNPDANAAISSVALLPDGRVIIVGAFTTIGGTARSYVAAVTSSGSLDASYTLSANAATDRVYVLPSNRVFFGGGFSLIGGLARQHAAQIGTYVPATGVDTLRAPYPLVVPQMPRYNVITLEKIASGEWAIVANNNS